MPENFKERLLNYEVAPPESTWEIISANLTREVEEIAVSKRLYDYEVLPPLNVWKQVQQSLSNDNTVVPQFKVKGRLRNIYKMLAAAALLGVIATASLYISRVNTFKDSLSLVPANKPKDKEEALPSPPATPLAPFSGKFKPSTVVLPVADASAKLRKYNKESNKTLYNTKVKDPLVTVDESEIMIAAKPIRNNKGEIIQDHEILNDADNQYISITGPNGQQTKISSKFLHMLLFINDDSDIDEVDGYFDKTFLESLIWKSRFQDWRNKIMTTSLVPSSTNFMDILEFKDLILTDK